MKGIFKATVVVATALTASSAFAAGLFSRSPDRVGRTYTESSYWATPSGSAVTGSSAAGVVTNGPVVVVPSAIAPAPGPTMGPWQPGDTISNASSALWGVGG
ncbi:MAG TPA: hypothetical protein VFB08_14390 [Burkholderiales bacterium]|nr:hypothetical protein [Burkholderiales bacterium]